MPPHRTVRLVIVEDVRSEAVTFGLTSRFPAYSHSTVYRRYTSPRLEAPIGNTGSPALQALDRSLTRPGENPLVRVAAYYGWIANHIAYSDSDTPAGGALMALKTRSGVCTDFADLFVGMLRTDHIPAQLVTGYVMNNGANQNRLHEWVRFLLPGGGWVVADPTWAAAGDLAALHDDWHIPLYVGLRPDVSATWENFGLQESAITMRTRYRFSALLVHALPTAMRLPGTGAPRPFGPVLASP